MSDKNKAIITVGLAIIVLAGIFLYHGITGYNAVLTQAVAEEEKKIHAHIKALEKYSFGPYLSRADHLLKLNRSIVTAVANRDRETLYRVTLPIYEALKDGNPYFQVMHFHLPDGTTLLRMHNPEFYDDSLRNIREIIDTVTETKKPHSGFEIGRHGPFYRIAQPIFFKDEFVGVLEFGIKVHQLLEAAQMGLSGRAASYFQEKEWRKVDRDSQHYHMKQHGEFVLNTHDDPFFISLSPKTDLNLRLNNFEFDNKTYVLHSLPVFKNYRQEVIGGISISQDVTHLIQQKTRFLVQISLLVVVLTAACLSILYMSFNNLVRILEESKVKLNKTVSALTVEIAERKKAEKRALEAQNEWEKTFNVMSDVVTIQDRDMSIVRANQAAKDLFKVAEGELEGKKCHEIFRGSSEPCPGCPGVDSLQDVHSHSEIIAHEELGKIFHVTSAPIHDKNGELQYLIHTAKDITEQKRIEAELFQAHKMEAIGTLAGGIAHDFNNILSAILGFSEIAKLHLPDGSIAENDIDQILKAGKRATDLVKQILTFSRKSDTHHVPLAPHLIIKEALKMLHSSLPTSIDLQEDIDDKCGLIMADPTNIHQIVVNLCTNALHALEAEKGMIHVSLHRKEISAEQIAGEPGVSPGPFIVLEVRDTGHGMNQVTTKRIFDPYFTTKEVGKGTGLGLAVIHGIIQSYKGFIRVESEPGKGASFQIHIPALPQEMPSTDKTESHESLPHGTERILVVDDESNIVIINKEILDQLGYQVSGTTDSLDAFEKIRLDPDRFDLIITDQTMPNLTGAELAKEVLKIKPSMAIILCTGYSSVLSEKDALAMGIKKYARKPVDIATLAHITRQVLDDR